MTDDRVFCAVWCGEQAGVLVFYLFFYFVRVKWCPISCSRPDLIPRADLTFPLKRPQIDHVFVDWVQEDPFI